MSKTELKPCPFCGGTDLLKYHIYQAADACSACIECECCGASGRKYDVKVDQDGMLEDFDEYKQCLIDEWNFRRDEIHATDGVLKKLAEAEQGAKQAYLKLRESGVLASDWEDDDERKSHYFMLLNGVEETAQRLLQQIKTLVGIV